MIMNKTTSILRMMRPQQWIKNLFVFVPMFFGGCLTDTADIVASAMVFAAFCLAASSIYCLNDVADVAADRRHPEKCSRPVASGAVSIAEAYAVMVALAAAAALILALLPGSAAMAAMITGAYWLLNIAYCKWLKHISIVDVCVVSLGFVLRILAGGVATGVPLSRWLVLMTFLLTLFMSLAKRRDDVVRMNKTGHAPRATTRRYNLTFINQAITITGTVMLVCYIMYTVSPDVELNARTDYLYLTSIFVVLGLLRYMQIAFVDEKSGDPTRIALSDRFIQAVVIGWVAAFLVMIYG